MLLAGDPPPAVFLPLGFDAGEETSSSSSINSIPLAIAIAIELN